MTAPAVRFVDVHFAYPGGRRFGVAGLDFDVQAGEILGVIGPNSAGKTTLVRLLSGLLTPAAGAIALAGTPLGALSGRELARRVAVVPQELPQAVPFTVGELVLMGRYPHGAGRLFEGDEDRREADAAMAAVGVRDLARRPLDALSGGERQRAVIARALAQRPRVLVLDEPTTHLDLRYQAACAGLLQHQARDEGLAVVLVTHDLGFAAELADRLLLLADGRPVALGAPADVLDSERLARVFGAPVIVDRSGPGARPHVRIAWADAARSTGGR